MLYVALLRGINVGGNNIIKMADLKRCFEQMGFTNVKTYIQSGNVIFHSGKKDLEELTVEIEKKLGETFHYSSRVILLTEERFEKGVKQAPQGFGESPEKYRYDVIFVKPPFVAKELIKEIPTKEGVDEVEAGDHALYFSRLIEKATQSRLPKLIQLPIYQQVSIRNWNTTTKLLFLLKNK